MPYIFTLQKYQDVLSIRKRILADPTRQATLHQKLKGRLADLEDRHMDGEDPVEVFDLPHISTKPTYNELLIALDKLSVPSPLWGSRVASAPSSRTYQKEFAKYLTDIISSNLNWLNDDDKIVVMDLACATLSERCGPTATPDKTRDFKIPSTQWSPELTITLHEPSLTGDNLGLKTWAAAYMLARRLPHTAATHDILDILRNPDSFRGVLELGSGTGLVGIAAAAIFHCKVVLTDLPEIVDNLRLNIQKNSDLISRNGGNASAEILDWFHYELSRPYLPDDLAGTESPKIPPHSFPCIIAADSLYDPHHAVLVAQVVDYTLANNGQSRFILELPLRDQATRRMRDELQKKLELKDFQLLESGTEDGFDDWEDAYGEPAIVNCWWGVWGRKMTAIE